MADSSPEGDFFSEPGAIDVFNQSPGERAAMRVPNLFINLYNPLTHSITV